MLFIAKENGPLVSAGIGLYLILVRGQIRTGSLILLLSALVAYLVIAVIMPEFRDEPWDKYSRLGPLADAGPKASYLFFLLLGVGFLPLFHWRSFVCCLPLAALNVSVAYIPQYSSNYHYDDTLSLFLLVSAMHGAIVLANLINKQVPYRWRLPAYGSFIGFLLLQAYNVGYTPAEFVFHHSPKSQDFELKAALEPLIENKDIGIATRQNLGPFLSLRNRYVGLHDNKLGDRIERLVSGDLVINAPRFRPEGYKALKQELDTHGAFILIKSNRFYDVYEFTNATAGD